jgi:hypothetical protein
MGNLIKECCENQRPFQFGTDVYVYKSKPRIDVAIVLKNANGLMLDLVTGWTGSHCKDSPSYDMVSDSREFLTTHKSDRIKASLLLTPKRSQILNPTNRGQNSSRDSSSRGTGNLAGVDLPWQDKCITGRKLRQYTDERCATMPCLSSTDAQDKSGSETLVSTGTEQSNFLRP